MEGISAGESVSRSLLGERTVPGVATENYWFRRHEVAYLGLAGRCACATVLETGCGEGYGANVLAKHASRVIALDDDGPSIRHVAGHYRRLDAVQANLQRLPVTDRAVDVVTSFQAIEHLADQAAFLSECLRVLRRGGELLLTTPNRLTFSPGRETPLNPFHTRELAPSELDELLRTAGFDVVLLHAVHHGPRLQALDVKHGGSIIDAQLAALFGSLPGQGTLPPELHADVTSVQARDFVIDGDDVAAGLDLVAVAVRP